MVRSQLFYGSAGSKGNEQGSVKKNHLCLGQLQTSNSIHYPLDYQIFYTLRKASLGKSLWPLPEIFLNIPLQSSENRIYLSLLGETARSHVWGSSPLELVPGVEPSCILREFSLLEFEKFIVLSVARYRKEKREISLNYCENFIEN